MIEFQGKIVNQNVKCTFAKPLTDKQRVVDRDISYNFFTTRKLYFLQVVKKTGIEERRNNKTLIDRI